MGGLHSFIHIVSDLGESQIHLSIRGYGEKKVRESYTGNQITSERRQKHVKTTQANIGEKQKWTWDKEERGKKRKKTSITTKKYAIEIRKQDKTHTL